ncbi:CRISPR-associated endonuclease Cas1 [Caldimonas tepidiphila]|uniref:CRISPR-associated endonuclease Cas1 n=1 Tax=Caldimonas tepidiphila TaxID=2315841 RepID=UPI0014729250|nr:CRISPR-associated endonuclease Cas1 [Caldimonas tepidiphila]
MLVSCTRWPPAAWLLVSDLIEEFRSLVVDAVALVLWREGRLRDTDFESTCWRRSWMVGSSAPVRSG